MKKLVLAGLGIAGLGVVGMDQAPRIRAAPASVDAAYATPQRAVKAPPSGELELALITRGGKDVEIGDLFAAPPPAAPPPPPATPVSAKPPEPPAPTAPPLPFTYFGRMTKGGKVIVYLLRNQELVLAESGGTLDGSYRVDSITASGVQFTYLPLQARQDLTIPSGQ